MSISITGISAQVTTAASDHLLILSIRCGDWLGPTAYVQWDSSSTADTVANKLRELADMVLKVAPLHMREA